VHGAVGSSNGPLVPAACMAYSPTTIVNTLWYHSLGYTRTYDVSRINTPVPITNYLLFELPARESSPPDRVAPDSRVALPGHRGPGPRTAVTRSLTPPACR
jgi:hypothetical protein